jgi:hypothetical protein
MTKYLIVATFAVLLWASPASATFTVGYSAFDCSLAANIAHIEDDDPELDYGWADGMAWTMKPPSLSPTIFCPIIGWSTPILSAQITVWDKSTQNDVTCTLLTTDDNGITKYTSSKHTTSVNFTSPMTLTWTQNEITGGGTYAMISCRIPGQKQAPIVFYSAVF